MPNESPIIQNKYDFQSGIVKNEFLIFFWLQFAYWSKWMFFLLACMTILYFAEKYISPTKGKFAGKK